ncbi:AAA domain-containing protein [Sulfurimonas sp.]|uniref:DEAD/DEAH box helicase n=1 Tax=Sulfurimonas sp. TaxID=2022749 RepID=UPI0025D7F162|nr:AAA domain-containing protein [Sulfurimonas sp.]MBW6487512.1 AAA family ATPase [Sulfurimonas sp.]
MDIIKKIDAEISAPKKTKKPIHLTLTKKEDGSYRSLLPFKIESGEYILNSSSIKDKAVVLEYEDGVIRIELDSEEEQINAFLSKDENAILKAIKGVISNDNFCHEPSFIVGPPGTGKTKVITKILEKTVENNLRVLVVSPTNKAVENVFERIDLEALDLILGDVVVSITTDHKDIQQLSPENLKLKKLQPIEDEIQILEETKQDALKQKRDYQPKLRSLELEQESNHTALSNIKRDIEAKKHTLKSVKSILSDLDFRIKVLTGNEMLRSVASAIMGRKLTELDSEKKAEELRKKEVEKEILTLDQKALETESTTSTTKKSVDTVMKEFGELNKLIQMIDKQLQELKKKREQLKKNDVFATAKIVGATLFGAALNQKIQQGNFDIVIVDEVSMAILPLLITASQALNDRQIDFACANDSSLYDAQNKAVALALKSKFVLVGDPKQLQPIAKTWDLKQSVFSFYGIEEMFKGNAVKNTVLLDINFRNHPHITSLSSKLFYGGMLKSGKEDSATKSLYIRKSTSKMVHSNGSFINHGNMKIVVEQVTKALERGRRSIGIITPYKKQAALIDEALSPLKKEYPDADIQAGTVHVFQGKEAEIIIYDLTFSPSEKSDYIPPAYDGDIASDTAKLLNVAMTRAESFFIVVGDVEGILNLKNRGLVLKDWVFEINELK